MNEITSDYSLSCHRSIANQTQSITLTISISCKTCSSTCTLNKFITLIDLIYIVFWPNLYLLYFPLVRFKYFGSHINLKCKLVCCSDDYKRHWKGHLNKKSTYMNQFKMQGMCKSILITILNILCLICIIATYSH